MSGWGWLNHRPRMRHSCEATAGGQGPTVPQRPTWSQRPDNPGEEPHPAVTLRHMHRMLTKTWTHLPPPSPGVLELGYGLCVTHPQSPTSREMARMEESRGIYGI